MAAEILLKVALYPLSGINFDMTYFRIA